MMSIMPDVIHQEVPSQPCAATKPKSQEAPHGRQRLPLEALKQWQQLEYGMFLHVGMSTYEGKELSNGNSPATTFAPDQLDVDQWVQVARDAGMRYVVLTAKHVAGFALWPSRHTDYHVGHSANRTDIVEQFVRSCERRGVQPAVYYCSWDNHHTFGSLTRSHMPYFDVPKGDYQVSQLNRIQAFTTSEYRDFQLAQVEELLRNYGPFEQVWIDIPGILSHEARIKQYQQIVELNPQAKITMNHGGTDGNTILLDRVWPTDVLTMERHLPASPRGYEPWKRLTLRRDDVGSYYIPAEVCDTITPSWFHVEQEPVRSNAELLGMRLLCRERGVNLLLNVPVDRRGLIPQRLIDSLTQLQIQFEQVYR